MKKYILFILFIFLVTLSILYIKGMISTEQYVYASGIAAGGTLASKIIDIVTYLFSKKENEIKKEVETK